MIRTQRIESVESGGEKPLDRSVVADHFCSLNPRCEKWIRSEFVTHLKKIVVKMREEEASRTLSYASSTAATLSVGI
jgi:hypothetical protein